MNAKSREEVILDDLNRHFPEFIDPLISWKSLPRGEDPPDAIGTTTKGERFGLELTEWLHEDQMTRAKGREAMREDLARIFDWQNHPVPENFQNVVVGPCWGTKVKRAYEERLRQEFHSATHKVDQNWELESQSVPVILGEPELTAYPILSKYVAWIRFQPGVATSLTQHGISWIDFRQDGGAYDPHVAVQALLDSIGEKAVHFETPERIAHIGEKHLDQLVLLVHGGFNQYAYNTSFHAPWRTLRDVVQEAAAFCAANPTLFNQIWLFHSLGDKRSLTQLWPELHFVERTTSR